MYPKEIIQQHNNNFPSRHYSVPYVPEIEGIEEFKGFVQHSKTYRSAETYRNLRVVVLGAASSGMDIAVEVSAVAEEVRTSYGYISVIYLFIYCLSTSVKICAYFIAWSVTLWCNRD